MAKRKTTVSVIIDQRTTTEEGRHPVKLRVTHERVNRTYSLKIYLSSDEFEKLSSTKRVDSRIKDAQVTATYYTNKAQEIIDKMSDFSFEEFRERLFPTIKEEQKEYSRIDALFKERIGELRNSGNVSTYQSYETALNSLLSFKKNLKWTEITVKFLNDYEKNSIDNGKSYTTVGIYLRTLRAVFNTAIDKGVVPRENYPFGRKKYEIPAGRNIKKALNVQDIKKIMDYDVEGNASIELSKDMFLFSYLCNGLNIKDICLLKKQDIDGDILTYVRAKTSKTRKASIKPIVVYLHPTAKEIIAKYHSASNGDFVFPFISGNLAPEQVRSKVQNLTKVVNKYLKRMGEELGLGSNIRTYTARHTFSTVLKRSGVSTEFISESLGHSDLRTTESYLDSFEDETKKKFSDLLTNF